MNNEFRTQDIKLATYLKVNGVEQIGLEAVDQFNSSFVFESPPEQLLAQWFNDSSKTQMIIDTYRALLRNARMAQQKSKRGEQ